MIAYWTDPYPEELLYSALARLGDALNYDSPSALARLAFGRLASASYDLPTDIDALIARLPPHHSYTANQLIQEHTLLPYYTHFMTKNRSEAARDAMCSSSSRLTRQQLIRVISEPESLCFCPKCVEEQRATIGEPYWVRSHQVPGNSVCATHACFLERSTVSRRRNSNPLAYSSLERALRDQDVAPRDIDPSSSSHHLLLMLSEDVSWLMSNHGHASPQALVALYRRRLQELGLVSVGRKTHYTEVAAAFDAWLPQEARLWFRDMHAYSSTELWLRRMMQTGDSAQNPMYHLILLRFLGFEGVGAMFSASEALPTRQPPVSPLERGCETAPLDDRIPRWRSEWADLTLSHPEASRTQLRRLRPALFAHLAQSDPVWLDRHLPPRHPRRAAGIAGPYKDWGTQDANLALKVKVAVKRLLNSPGAPKRVTARAIERQLGHQLPSDLSRLPRTVTTLRELTESRVQFALRRIEWTANRLALEGKVLSRSQFVRAANVQYLLHLKPIETAVDRTLNVLAERKSVWQDVAPSSDSA